MTLVWDEYDVTVTLADRLIGGIPVMHDGVDRRDALEGWARGQGVDEPAALADDLVGDLDLPVSAEKIEGLMTGFKRDEEHGLYVEARQVKAMLRESAQRLGLIKSVKGMRQVLQHDLHVRSPIDGSQKLYVGRTEPDGVESRPISVVTRQGPRTAIKTFEYVEGVTVVFRVRILRSGLAGGTMSRDRLLDMLALGECLGLGADRSQGEGTFTVDDVKDVGAMLVDEHGEVVSSEADA